MFWWFWEDEGRLGDWKFTRCFWTIVVLGFRWVEEFSIVGISLFELAFESEAWLFRLWWGLW